MYHTQKSMLKEHVETEQSNANDNRGRFEELIEAGFGQRSIQVPSRPIYNRAIGVTAKAAASAMNTAKKL